MKYTCDLIKVSSTFTIAPCWLWTRGSTEPPSHVELVETSRWRVDRRHKEPHHRDENPWCHQLPPVMVVTNLKLRNPFASRSNFIQTQFANSKPQASTTHQPHHNTKGTSLTLTTHQNVLYKQITCTPKWSEPDQESLVLHSDGCPFCPFSQECCDRGGSPPSVLHDLHDLPRRTCN